MDADVPTELRSRISDEERRADLSSLGLTSVPDWLRGMVSVTDLDLSQNQLSEVPDWVSGLPSLRVLRLSDNSLTRLPDSLAGHTTLIALDVRRNGLVELPEWLGELTSLRFLDASDNLLTFVPSTLERLTDLDGLFLGGNNLSAVPDALRRMTALTVLDLSGPQRLVFLNWWFLNVGFDLWWPNFSFDFSVMRAADAMGLPGLAEIDLSRNRLGLVSAMAGAMSPAYFGDARGRQTGTGWGIRGGQLTRLPDWVGDLASLRVLGLARNRLSTLPDSLQRLTGLTSVDVSGNLLSELPRWLGSLTSLSALDVSSNQLTTLPESLADLDGLMRLSVRGNQLSDVPSRLGLIAGLQRLDLADNPLHSPLREISEDGIDAVKAYLGLLTQSSAELWESKLLIVGEGSVGKTSLVKAVTGQPFDPFEPSTHGIRITTLELSHPDRPDVQMDLSAWDFGGQDIYHATHRSS
jgi:Leucine-rich repeat (LRR) protein